MAAGALAYCGPLANPLLRQALQDQDKEVRKRAAWALGKVADQESRLALRTALNDPAYEVAGRPSGL
ncbi:MAG: HEAT repeat domain-containing protein [Thermoguttaceae bacterium]|nr:HEAT repeat domain-containing protein [Thermoguttaceae bacterium]